MGTVWWCLWSVSLHSRQMQTCSSLQKSSRRRSCFPQILSSRFSTGSISLCRAREGTRWWGSRWSSQYDVRHTRQDFRALNFVSVHTSHVTCHGKSALSCASTFLFFIWTEISSMTRFVEISGLTWNLLLHIGQWHNSLRSQCSLRQVLQKLWPQGVVTGSVKKLRQIEHSKRLPDKEARTLNDDIMKSLWKKITHIYAKFICSIPLFTSCLVQLQTLRRQDMGEQKASFNFT